jgi:hypothetical protein
VVLGVGATLVLVARLTSHPGRRAAPAQRDP